MEKLTGKETKSVIYEAYTKLAKELEEKNKMIDNPVELAKKAESDAKLANTAEVIAGDNFWLNQDIVKDYEDLAYSIDTKKVELKELYDICDTLNSAAVAVSAKKVVIADLDEEYKTKKSEIDAKIKEAEDSYKEKLAEINNSLIKARKEKDAEEADYAKTLKKQREREQEEYNYNLNKARRADRDDWAREKAKIEDELQKRLDAADDKETAIANREDEILAIKEKIDAFPNELAYAKAEAADEAKKKAEKAFEFERRALKSNAEHAASMAEATITSLKEQIAKVTAEKDSALAKLDKAYEEMKDLAVKAAQASQPKVITTNEK